MIFLFQDLGISNNGDGVSHRVAAWERRVAAARAGDILRGLKARRARTLRDAQQHAQEDEAAWREQGKNRFYLNVYCIFVGNYTTKTL